MLTVFKFVLTLKLYIFYCLIWERKFFELKGALFFFNSEDINIIHKLKVSFFLFLASKLSKLDENIYREDQISLFPTSKNYETFIRFKFGLFFSIAYGTKSAGREISSIIGIILKNLGSFFNIKMNKHWNFVNFFWLTMDAGMGPRRRKKL